MLAKKWSPSTDPTGWWASEKYDGVRAYWDGKKLLTRNNNVIHAPAWFLRDLPKTALDGELFIGRKRFDETSGIVRKKTPVDSEWKKIRYIAFDAPQAAGGFESRDKALQSACAGRTWVKRAAQTKVKSAAHLRELFEKVVKAGGEGIMLRAPKSAYERTRSSKLLKVKVMPKTEGRGRGGGKQKLLGEDHEEAKIIGHIEGTGKHEGRLGAYKAKLLSNGAIFRVGTGLTDAHRNKPLRIGTIIVVGFQELTSKGTPRFPKYVGRRAD